MLARLIEGQGIATLTVTMMPEVAQKLGAPRIVGVEFPFGHAFGVPNDAEMQRAVCEAAVDLLDSAREPGSRRDVEIEWPQPPEVAYRDWQPSVPSPIVQYRRRQAESA